MLIYTGIGHRDTPEHILALFREVGAFLASKNCVLRSGGAQGADSAFEEGCDQRNGAKEIYLPYKGFRGNKSELYGIADDEAALTLAAKYHQRWSSLSQKAKLLIGRNVYQVLGKDLKTVSDFIICYSVKPSGTNMTLRVAADYNVSIYNLGDNETWPVEKHNEIFDVLEEKYRF